MKLICNATFSIALADKFIIGSTLPFKISITYIAIAAIRCTTMVYEFNFSGSEPRSVGLLILKQESLHRRT